MQSVSKNSQYDELKNICWGYTWVNSAFDYFYHLASAFALIALKNKGRVAMGKIEAFFERLSLLLSPYEPFAYQLDQDPELLSQAYEDLVEI